MGLGLAVLLVLLAFGLLSDMGLVLGYIWRILSVGASVVTGQWRDGLNKIVARTCSYTAFVHLLAASACEM
jgi:hypothetical protein